MIVQAIAEWTGGWLLIGYVLLAGIFCTLALRFIQVRYFGRAWRSMLFPPKAETIPVSMPDKESMTPLQAFINTLSANLGNGSIAGMATAIYSGGPGAAFWVFVVGCLLMAVRFAEVYLSVYYSTLFPSRAGLGGPMLYLQNVAGGKLLATAYAVLCLLLGYLMGNAIQTNSIRISVAKTWGVSPLVTAFFMVLFVAYVVTGGASRIVKLSAKIVPFKVILFFSSTLIILLYHYKTLGDAFTLIMQGAFCPQAIAGGAVGLTVQHALRYGITRSIFATESGLGTAAILYGSTGTKEVAQTSIISMLSTFISTLGCFIISLCIIASGVWDSGLTSTALTIAVFETVFGSLGGWMVTFLSVSFGIGVMVVFAYIARETWLYLTQDRWIWLFNLSYCAVAVVGIMTDVTTLWSMSDILIAFMLIINLYGVIMQLPTIQKGLAHFHKV